jgi:vesicle coat complex subunit
LFYNCKEWDAAYRKQDAFQKEASRFVKKLEREHVNAAAMYSQHLATRQFGVPDPVVQQHYFREQDVRVTEMLRLCDDRDKAVTEMARFAFCLKHLGNHVESTGGTAGNTKHTTGTTNNTTGTTTNVTTNRTRTTTNFSHQRDLRVVRNALEASFVDDAEIVFATLTSSSRRYVLPFPNPDTVCRLSRVITHSHGPKD